VKQVCIAACLAVLAVLLPGAARADSVQVALTNAGSNYIFDSNAGEAVPVGPYSATVTSASGSSNVLVICDDYDTTALISPPAPPFNATVTQVGDPDFTAGLKFGSGTDATGDSAATNYDAAAWLAQQIMADYNSITPTSTPAYIAATDTDIDYLNYALFAIFSPETPGAPDPTLSSAWNSTAAAYLNTALTQTYTPGEFSDVEVLTPQPNSSSQEFLTITAPEPSSLLLLLIGLAGLAVIMLRRKRETRSL
jgi:hypothetical protein